jgi:cytoskeleton protein RodZ
MTMIGEQLRAVREERNISLLAISNETKISLRYLEAVEKTDPSALPGAVFARNFTRQYANYLGLDSLGLTPAQLDERIRLAFPSEAETAPATNANGSLLQSAPSQPIHVEPLADSWNWKRLGLSTLALVAVLAVGGGLYWVLQTAPGMIASARQEAQRKEELSQQAAKLEAEQQAVREASLRKQQAQAELPRVEVASQTTDTPTGEKVSDTTITISGNGMAVRLVAEQDTWVRMTANGELLFSEVIKANESRTISGVERARMVIGNAGGVKIATNGKDIGPIGPPGKVRVVLLSPEGPQIAPPAI